ncbi:MAG: hypothetical protein CMJ78_20305 [Planctomycetaceae bacterium]|nr:hypothetical protein [Planctomycetaceae bacterium]
MNRVAMTFMILALANLSLAKADVVKLQNGGELRGKILSQPKEKEKPVVIQTLSGAVVRVEQANVQFVTKRRLIIEEYETRKRFVPDTEEAHWQMATWCRSNNLVKQRAVHLERVIELSPDHEQARYGLGHTRRNGVWMSPAEKDAEMRAKGYVKYKGRYITEEEFLLLEQTEIEIAAEREWFQKLKPLHKRLIGRDDRKSRAAYEDIKKIDSPHAVRALVNFFGDDKNKNVRRLYVEVLSQIEGLKPVEPLVNACLLDSDKKVRELAMESFAKDQFKAATAFLIDGLGSEHNIVVRRAGVALEQIGTTEVIPFLIEALTSTHKYKVRGPSDTPTYSFNTNGSFGQLQSPVPPEIALMLLTGQLPNGVIVLNQGQPNAPTKIYTVRFTHKNPEVRAALKKLTGEDYGYDARSWRLWLAANTKLKGVAPAVN